VFFLQEEEEASGEQPASLLSIGSFTAPFSNRKPALDRKISVMSNYSTVSEDSLGFENALEAATSAVGIARAASTRTSKRSKRSVARMDSELALSSGAGGAAIAAVPELEEELVKVDNLRIMRIQLKDWPYVVIGIVGSIVMGAAMPVYALLFGEVLGVLRLPSQQAREECVYFCGLFVATGVTAGIAIFLQISMFCVAGESLTQRMRKAAFSAMLRQEMGWFDRPQNSVGALLSRLSADSSAIQGATGSRIGAILHAAFTLIISITLSLVLEWRMGLVGCVFVPLILVATVIQFKVISGQNTAENGALQRASKLAVEAISNIRTVAGLGKEAYFIREYERELRAPHEVAKRQSHLRGLIFGFSQAMPFFAYSGCMYYGGYLVYSEGIEYKNVFKVRFSCKFLFLFCKTFLSTEKLLNNIFLLYCIVF
jgi:ATP-binding cassette subfamily B (MDR/TAP) protein 1